jgi:hypothetical protein
LFEVDTFKLLGDLEGQLGHADAVDVADDGDDNALWYLLLGVDEL